MQTAYFNFIPAYYYILSKIDVQVYKTNTKPA
jgi:hypothetical protein